MLSYIIRRLLLIIPTLWAIITVNFFIVQVAPGGPVEQMVAEMRGLRVNTRMERLSGITADEVTRSGKDEDSSSVYRGARGLDPEVIEEIKRRFGFDRPLYIRYFDMLKRYVVFDFGESLFRGNTVIRLIATRLPVSISLGIWSTLFIYLISIPLGISKAVKHGSRFDLATSTVVTVGYAIPSFLFAILLIVLLAGGSYLKLFPLRGLVSTNFQEFSFFGKIADYFWHLALPITALTIGGYATLTMLTKNSFLDEINKQYVMTARAKGLTERKTLFGHVFRNAMLLIIAGFPAAFISMFFTGSVLIEVMFSLEGLGLLGFEAATQRDYPLMFATLYIFTLMGLLLGLISDITYTLVDPRIDFESRKA